LKIEKADTPIVDVMNLNNFTKYNEYWVDKLERQ
jgi:hypothetical protein